MNFYYTYAYLREDGKDKTISLPHLEKWWKIY